MVIGLDFDNTIVSYDRLFHQVARDLGVVPETIPPKKNAVRDFLRSIGREAVWTEMQGTVYGSRMNEAESFPGALEAIAAWRRAGNRVVIISHKTRFPFLGEQHDLHSAALRWLKINGFFDPSGIGMEITDAFFELTKEEKLARIQQQQCTHFVDDLPEILLHPKFPSGTQPILFDPSDALHGPGPWIRATSWQHMVENVK